MRNVLAGVGVAAISLCLIGVAYKLFLSFIAPLLGP
jgi:hypothetical protein